MIGPDRLAPPASVRAIREASPQARHHFTRFDQVNQLVGASEADPDLGFMGRTMALCSLPRSNPGNRLQYKRVNGPYKGRRQNAASLHAKLTRRANPVPKKASEPVWPRSLLPSEALVAFARTSGQPKQLISKGLLLPCIFTAFCPLTQGDGVHPQRLHRNHQIEIRALNVTMPARGHHRTDRGQLGEVFNHLAKRVGERVP